MSVTVYDFQSLSFFDQTKLARETDVLLGIHGFALTIVLYLIPGSQILEIKRKTLYPEYQYRNLAHMVGVEYESFEGDDEFIGSDKMKTIYDGVEKAVAFIRKERIQKSLSKKISLPWS